MNSTKNYVIALLVLTTIGGATLAWNEYRELVGLRAAALSEKERADLQKRIWDLQKANKELEERLAAAGHVEGEEMASDAEEAPAQPGDNRGQRGPQRGNRGGQQFAAMRELMAKPEVQALLAAGQKAVIDGRYAALFKSLNLTPEQADKLKALLAERQNVRQDVMAAAREQGLDPRTDRDSMRKLVTDSQNAINENIKSLIGADAFSKLTNYEQTMPQRDLVSVLQQRLNATDTPLTTAQAEQLVQILAANTPPRNTGNANAGNNEGFRFGAGGGPGGFGGFGGRDFGGGALGGAVASVAGPGAAPITAQAVAQAAPVLSQPQLDVLQQLQQQQQNAQKLQQLMRGATQQNTQAGTGNSTAQPAAGTGRRRGGG